LSFWKSFAMNIVKIVVSLVVISILAAVGLFVIVFHIMLLCGLLLSLTQPPLIAILGVLGIIIVVAFEVAVVEWLSDLGLFAPSPSPPPPSAMMRVNPSTNSNTYHLHYYDIKVQSSVSSEDDYDYIC